MVRRINAGEPFDFLVAAPVQIDRLISQEKIIAEKRTDLARSGIGFAVRAGASKPDISSVGGFKRALLRARSIASLKEGHSGVYVAGVLEWPIPDILRTRLHAASTLSLNCIRLAHPPGGLHEPLLDHAERVGDSGAGFSVLRSERRFSVQMNWEFHMSSKGTIKRIVSEKGFGFVADESGQEYFFHQSACQSFDSLREGQAVTFQTGQGPKGPRAENVRES
jgi:CspA family cold shock protein